MSRRDAARLGIALLCCLACGPRSFAAEEAPPAAAEKEAEGARGRKEPSRGKDGGGETTYAVVGATVFPASRPMIRRGTVIWREGKIAAVGSEIELPEGAEVIPGDGLYVTPGLIAVAAAGVGMEPAQGDIAHSLDPYDLELRISLAHGITTIQLVDARATIGFGRDSTVSQGANSAIIKLTYGDLDSMLVREPAFNYLSLPGRQIELNLFTLREQFRKAAEHLKKTREAKEAKKPPPKVPRGLGTYVTILENERPTVISRLSRMQVKVAWELSETYGFDLVLSEPDEAWPMASEFAARGVPVLVKSRGRDFSFNTGGPVLEEGDMIAIRRPAAFASGGALVAILPYRRSVSLSGLAGRDLTALALDAAFAVRGGMSEEDALRAVTLNPARILRIDDRVGSLEEGKDADLLIFSGHPLDYRSCVLKAFINGKVYYDRRTSRLFRRVPVKRREL